MNGQRIYLRHSVQPFQPFLLSLEHGQTELAAVVLVDDAVLRALHDADRLQVLRAVLVARLHGLQDPDAVPLPEEKGHGHDPHEDEDEKDDHLFRLSAVSDSHVVTTSVICKDYKQMNVNNETRVSREG